MQQSTFTQNMMQLLMLAISFLIYPHDSYAYNFKKLDTLLEQGRREKIFPGCAAYIYHQGNIIYHNVCGTYTYHPHAKKITRTTLFDIASLTKIITTISAMLLYDAGKLSLEDPVHHFIPCFTFSDKKSIKIKHLLTHTSGLTDKALLKNRTPHTLLEDICASSLAAIPGTAFLYSDINMILLQKIIEEISQQPFHDFVRQHITQPLGMKTTAFNPSEKSQCAPTRASAPNRPYLLQGEVDDDHAWLSDGIAGHAGLFSTAQDFAQCMLMLLHDGTFVRDGKKYQFITPETVTEWTSLHADFSDTDEKGKRGYGFEIGRHLSPNAFGHFGWTGTSAWADPEHDLCCLLFTNRVHPSYGDAEKMKQFRKQFHDCVLDIITHQIQVGAEQTEQYLPLLKNKNVGILTNHTAHVGKQHLVDLLRAKKIHIKKIFTPEHGFRGKADAEIHCADGIDLKTGIPLVSLYGQKKKPTPQDLADIDILIFDIQDIGARFYTYISSLQYLMEAAAEQNMPLIILDRPNPNGFYIDGPICEMKSFVGMQPIPIVHGMTVGEYAQMLNGEQWLAEKKQCTLTVIPCKNYTHKDLYQLPIFPSPNIKSMNAVYLYPSTCLFEGTQISMGRGTKHPFEMFGHPAFPKTKFSFVPKRQSAHDSTLLRHADKRCYGYNLVDTPEHTLKKLNNKINIAWLQKSYTLFPAKEQFFTKLFPCLAGNKLVAQHIARGDSEKKIRASWRPGLEKFKKIRKKYLLYEDFE